MILLSLLSLYYQHSIVLNKAFFVLYLKCNFQLKSRHCLWFSLLDFCGRMVTLFALVNSLSISCELQKY